MKTRPHKCNANQDGFVLAELLVAMVVLAIAAIAFLQTVQTSAKQMQNIKTNVAKNTLAINLMNTALSQTADNTDAKEGQDVKTGLYWRLTTLPDANLRSQNAEQPSISILNVEVWKQGQPPLTLTSAKWGGGE